MRIAVDFDDVLKLGVGNNGHGVGKRCSKLQFYMNDPMLGQVEMFLFGDILADVKCVQGIAVGVVFTYKIVPSSRFSLPVPENRLMYAWMCCWLSNLVSAA